MGCIATDRMMRIDVAQAVLDADELAGLGIGSSVLLDDSNSDDVTVHMNGKAIATGELVVVDGMFAVRVSEVAGSLCPQPQMSEAI